MAKKEAKKSLQNKKKKKVLTKIKKNSRRNIRKIIKNVDLSQFTQIALKNERARKQRLIERKKIVCIFCLHEIVFRVFSSNFTSKLCFSFSSMQQKNLFRKMNWC